MQGLPCRFGFSAMVRWEEVEEIDSYLKEKEKARKGKKYKEKEKSPARKKTETPSKGPVKPFAVPKKPLVPTTNNNPNAGKPKKVEYGIESIQIEGLEEKGETPFSGEDKELEELSKTSREIESTTRKMESEKQEKERVQGLQSIERVPENPFREKNKNVQEAQKKTEGPAMPWEEKGLDTQTFPMETRSGDEKIPAFQGPSQGTRPEEEKTKTLEELKRLVAEKQKEEMERKKKQKQEDKENSTDAEWHYD